MKNALIVMAALFLAGCVSNTTVETRLVQDAQTADARRRAELHTSLAAQYYTRGNFVVALEETRLAEKDDPKYYPAYNVRGAHLHGASRGRAGPPVLRAGARPRAARPGRA